MLTTNEGWYGLQFYSGTVTGSKVSYAQVKYAGGNGDAAIVGETGLPKSSVTLDHVAISMNVAGCGGTPVGILSMDTPSGFITTNCTFNGKPAP
jgi:hypothetical protein